MAAVMALGLAGWQDPLLAAALANLAAGVVVGKVGTAPIFRAELERELGRRETGLEDKILGPAELGLQVAHLQAQGKKVVFTNGCFDLLHGGHIKFLEDSRRLGDALVVALDYRRLGAPGERGGAAGHRRGPAPAPPGGPGSGGLRHPL